MSGEVDVERWGPHLRAAHRAGQTLAQYARERGLSRHTLGFAAQVESLQQQNTTLRTERDLLKERLNALLRRIFAAKSEVRENVERKDLFLNEAEALASNAHSAPAEEASRRLQSRSPRTAVQSAAASRLIRRCRARSFAMSCPRRSGAARTTARGSPRSGWR